MHQPQRVVNGAVPTRRQALPPSEIEAVKIEVALEEQLVLQLHGAKCTARMPPPLMATAHAEAMVFVASIIFVSGVVL